MSTLLRDAGTPAHSQELYKRFFANAPSGQDFFKQSTTRLYLASLSKRIRCRLLKGGNLESQWLIITGCFKPIIANNGLLWGIVAYYFQLLGCPGSTMRAPFKGALIASSIANLGCAFCSPAVRSDLGELRSICKSKH